jgi:hypothetical protein
MLIIIMTLRSLLYFLHIGALSIRLNPTMTNIINKDHVLTNIHCYRLMFMTNTYSTITYAAVMLDSTSMYSFNGLVVILTYLILEKNFQE